MEPHPLIIPQPCPQLQLSQNSSISTISVASSGDDIAVVTENRERLLSATPSVMSSSPSVSRPSLSPFTPGHIITHSPSFSELDSEREEDDDENISSSERMDEVSSLHGIPLPLPPSHLHQSHTSQRTGIRYMASRASIHHFCTGMASQKRTIFTEKCSIFHLKIFHSQSH